MDDLAAEVAAHHVWRESGGERGARFVLAGRAVDTALVVRHDLEDADLTGLSLPGASLEGVRWAGATLVGADLRGARLSGDLRRADLAHARLNDAVLEGADLRGAALVGASLAGADVFAAYLDEANLLGADLTGIAPFGAIFEATMRDLQHRALATGGTAWFVEAVRQGDLEVAPLSSDGSGPAAVLLRALPPGLGPDRHPLPALVEFWLTPIPAPTWPDLLAQHTRWVASRGREGQRLSVPNADLRGRDLAGVNLQGASLLRARLQGARLGGACLDDALLLEADLTGTDLRGASFRRAHLRGARLAGAHLATDLRGADLRDVVLEHAAVASVALAGALLGGTELREAQWDVLEAAWWAALAGHAAATREALRGLQGGVPAGGLAPHLIALGVEPLAPALLALVEALQPGDMALSHPVARLLVGWTLQFIRAGGTAVRTTPEERPTLDPDALALRVAAHAQWLAGAGGAQLSLAGEVAYGLDLSGADLRRADLQGASLRGSVFDDADLREADLREADLREARLDGARLTDTRLDGARFDGCWLGAVQLEGASVAGASFARSLMTGAILRDMQCTDTSFAGALLAQADLRGGTFTRCDWRGTSLLGAQLDNARLQGPWVFGPALVQADLSPIEAVFHGLRAHPAAAQALAAALREPPPRRGLAAHVVGVLPEEEVSRARAWLVALTGDDGAEVDMAVDQTLVWLGVPAPTLWDEDEEHHHHH